MLIKFFRHSAGPINYLLGSGMKRENTKYYRTKKLQGSQDLITWNKGTQVKKEYYQRLYGDIKPPEP